MMLSLVDICLRSIMNGVENKNIRHLHNHVPSKLSQRLLDTVLVRGKIDNAIWKTELSSAEFLRGFRKIERRNESSDEYLSFSTQRGKVNDLEYLNLVAKSLASKLNNSETIGARIKELHLYFYLHDTAHFETVENNFGGIFQVIEQCTNLGSLDIKTKEDGGDVGSVFPLLSRAASAPIFEILGNLEELSLTGASSPTAFMAARYPVIQFTKLTSLRLTNCILYGWHWRELLESTKNTLVCLHLKNIDFESSVSSHLPIPFPLLKTFNMDSNFRCTSSFVANLRKCSKLENVFLSLESYSSGDFNRLFAEDEENLKALSRINAKLEVKICINKRNEDGIQITDIDSKFKMVSIFQEKITDLEVHVLPWNPCYTKALENVVDVCQNLISLAFLSPFLVKETENVTADVSDQGQVYSALTRFFNDQERASKLSNLLLISDIDFEIFEKCLNLNSLVIGDNKLMDDSHLIRLANRGVKLSTLAILSCDNITDAGLIPLLIGSGEKLTKLEIWESMGTITDRTWRILIDHCRNVKNVYGMPDDLREMALSKCFDIKFLTAPTMT